MFLQAKAVQTAQLSSATLIQAGCSPPAEMGGDGADFEGGQQWWKSVPNLTAFNPQIAPETSVMSKCSEPGNVRMTH